MFNPILVFDCLRISDKSWAFLPKFMCKPTKIDVEFLLCAKFKQISHFLRLILSPRALGSYPSYPFSVESCFMLLPNSFCILLPRNLIFMDVRNQLFSSCIRSYQQRLLDLVSVSSKRIYCH